MLNIAGGLSVGSLAGGGTKMVVTNNNGVLSTQIIPAGSGSSSVTIIQTELNFGSITGNTYDTSLFVSDTNILSGSTIVVSLSAVDTTDHSVDEVFTSGVFVSAGNNIVASGFTIYAYCEGGTYGKYKVNYLTKY